MEEVVVTEPDPLPLYQVLEEEYATLHGPLPIDYDLEEKDPNRRLAAICELIHKLPEPRTAVCLSGGGIRSGTFSLGVLQGLARRGLLDKFHYLSTVSGGGYIGSWLTAWSYRHPKGVAGTIEELALEKMTTRFEPEPAPIRNLRDYSSFLTPRFSLLSADVWTFVAIYLRNLILNWLVLIPLIIAVLAIPRLCIAFVRVHPPAAWGMWCSILVWTPFVLGVACAGLAVGYMGINRPTVSDLLPVDSKWRKPEYKDQKSFLWRCLLPLSLSAILLTTHWAWNTALHPPSAEETTPFLHPFSRSLVGFIALGVLVYLIGWIRYSFVLRGGIRWKELWFVFITGIVGGLLLWIVATKTFPDPIADPVIRNPNALYPEDDFIPHPITALYVCLASPLLLGTILLAVTFFIGITSRQFGKALIFEDEDREWLSRLGGWVLIIALVWAAFSLIVVFGPVALWKMPATITSLGGISGLVAILAGHSAKTAATSSESAKSGWQALIFDNILSIASMAFVVFFVAGLSLATSLPIEGVLLGLLKGLTGWDLSDWLAKGMTPVSCWYALDTAIPREPFGQLHLYKIIHYTPIRYLIGWIGVLSIFGFLMARVINLNKFSLHAAYRNRLIRAFLGASRSDEERRPNPFTGFDPTDNLQVHELRPGLLQLRSFKKDGLGKLVSKLKACSDFEGDAKTDPSAYLRASLSDQTRTMVDRYTGGAPSQSLKNDLLEDLNRVLETRYLYRLAAFSNLAVKDDANTMKLVDFLAPISREPRTSCSPDSKHTAETKGYSIRSLIEKKLLTPREREGVALLDHQEEERETDLLVSRSLRGVYLIGLNRYLLDEVYSEEIEEREFPLPPFKLMHVVNTALNLVGGDKLAWQQRKAESFSVSPLHSGSLNPMLGYRRSRDYGGPRGIALGTAVAISGAAASSNMGYLSTSSATTFVMTLFNARLGWWLGNTGKAGNDSYGRNCPNYSINPIVSEAFGLTDDQNPYVLLSDGGHFENLALYEMVLRRCKLIVVVDGGQDAEGKFDDLGNAVRKIRIDFGIPIDFSEVSIFPRRDKKEGRRCAVGRIRYGAIDKVKRVEDGKEIPADDGYLIYIKPAFYGTNEPRDVFNYAVAHDAFPHDTTADQWFDEPQFESYRMLGVHTMNEICGEAKKLSLEAKKLSLDEFLSLATAHSEMQDEGEDSEKNTVIKGPVDIAKRFDL